MINSVESSFITNDSIIEIIFFSGDVRQFPIGNSDSLNTKYFYGSLISNNSNTQISIYFLTVRTEWSGTVIRISIAKESTTIQSRNQFGLCIVYVYNLSNV